MRHRLKIVLFVGVWAVLFGHCDDEPISHTARPLDESDGNIKTLSSGIAIHRSENDSLYYLSGNVKNPVFKTVFEPSDDEKIAWFEVGPVLEDPKQLFALTTPANPRNTTQKRRLKRITTDGRPPTVYGVGSLFDRIEFGLDGQLAVLYHSGEALGQDGFFNPNEVALIDLTQKPGDGNPQMLSPPLGGQKIEMVSFIPKIRVGGADRQVLVFLAGNVVSIHDLNDPSNIWAKGPYVDAAGVGSLEPEQVIPMDETSGCTDKSCEARIFIRTRNTKDVYYMSLGASPVDFKGAEMNQLEAGGSPQDMAVVADQGVTYLAVLSFGDGATLINFINLMTGASFHFDVIYGLNQMVHLQGEAMNKLVLHGESAAGINFLPLDDIANRKNRNLDDIMVGRGIDQIVELEGNRLLVVPYASGGTNDLIILDLVDESAEIVSSGSEYNWSEAQIYEDVFYLIPDDEDRIDMLNLATGHPSALYLDDYTSSLHVLKGSSTAIAYHTTPTGRATLFPLKNPTRNNAKIIDGLWLEGVLNEKGE